MEAGVGIKIALKRRSRLTRALKKLMRAHSFFLSSLSICASVLTSSTFVFYLFVPIVINYFYIPICHSLFVCTSFTVVFSLFVPIVIKYMFIHISCSVSECSSFSVVSLCFCFNLFYLCFLSLCTYSDQVFAYTYLLFSL